MEKKRIYIDSRSKAKLVLEDGTIYSGYAFGSQGERFGEIVFNTGLTGYQEILTDPSYKGQIVTMTYPLIGNYGINPQDIESRKLFLEGFVVKEVSKIVSNWRAAMSLPEYLRKNKIVGIEDIDTRMLTKHLREKGAMRAVISSTDLNDKNLLKKVRQSPGLIGCDLTGEVSSNIIYDWNKEGKHKVVVIDCGVKLNIIRALAARRCQITVVPCTVKAQEILSLKPNGVMLSNGPGDPQAVTAVIDMIKQLLGKVPLLGICLGHQMMGLALGGKTYKLKFGHHGSNHPVKDLKTGKVLITTQNHGFCLNADSLSKDDVEITHINLNDNTLEGIRHKKIPAFSVQFHPESCPGPHDAAYLFDDFIDMIKSCKL